MTHMPPVPSKPEKNTNFHQLKTTQTTTKAMPCPAHVFSCWRSSYYACELWRVLRRRPKTPQRMRTWMIRLGWFSPLKKIKIGFLMLGSTPVLNPGFHAKHQKTNIPCFFNHWMDFCSFTFFFLEFRPQKISWGEPKVLCQVDSSIRTITLISAQHYFLVVEVRAFTNPF